MSTPTRQAVATALVLALSTGACGTADPPAPPAGSTLKATLADRDGDGRLESGPPEPLIDRTDIGPRREAGRVLATLGVLTDAHVRDEESPARVPFLDRLGEPYDSTFRPQEALTTQVLAATVRALNAEDPDAVLVAGDLIDSASRTELAQAQAVLDGGAVDPDTGAPGYDGVQHAGNADPFYYRPDVDPPVRAGLLAAAQRPFESPGLDAPWHATAGNHDALLAGELAPDARTDEIATGDRVVTAPPPGFDADAFPDPRDAIEVLLDTGTTERVAPDPERAALVAGAAPGAGDRVVRAGAATVVLLDSTDRRGGAAARVTQAQLDWLETTLEDAATRSVLVASHHPLPDEALAVLDRHPNVVAALNGHTHRHRITPHAGYWLISTASLADFPQQSRMIRVREHAIETWVVDHDGRDLAGTSRELAFLDAQGGRPKGFPGRPPDRNARLFTPPRAP